MKDMLHLLQGGGTKHTCIRTHIRAGAHKQRREKVSS